MEVTYTYWEGGDGWLVGYVDAYPDHLTQGHDLTELEAMLTDVYHIRQAEDNRLSGKRKRGVLRVTAKAIIKVFA